MGVDQDEKEGNEQEKTKNTRGAWPLFARPWCLPIVERFPKFLVLQMGPPSMGAVQRSQMGLPGKQTALQYIQMTVPYDQMIL